MHTRTTVGTDWDDDDDDFEPEHVVAVDDGFERGAALQSLWIHVRSQELRSGRVTAVLAGVTVDLREAGLSPEGATIHVQSALSGIDILVPPDWDIVWDVDAIWSGVGENRRAPRSAERRPRLRIAGMVVAGGLSVR
jgi:hypothetical protein